MTVKDLKDILNKLPDDMVVIIPVITEEDSNELLGFRHVKTAGVLECPGDIDTLCLNSSDNGADISYQVTNSTAIDRLVSCKKIMY